MNNSIVSGSLSDIAKLKNQSLAESFLSCDVIILLDTSGSMGAHDMNDGISRFARACTELTALQANLPGKIAVVSFSKNAQFCPSGVPFDEGGSTNLAGALRFVKVADVTDMKFVLISDGQPDAPDEALSVARTFKAKVDVIFIGPEGGSGQAFLEKLARATGGTQVTANNALLLSSTVQTLLLKS